MTYFKFFTYCTIKLSIYITQCQPLVYGVVFFLGVFYFKMEVSLPFDPFDHSYTNHGLLNYFFVIVILFAIYIQCV